MLADWCSPHLLLTTHPDSSDMVILLNTTIVFF